VESKALGGNHVEILPVMAQGVLTMRMPGAMARACAGQVMHVSREQCFGMRPVQYRSYCQILQCSQHNAKDEVEQGNKYLPGDRIPDHLKQSFTVSRGILAFDI
jgi:hypothetical protein